jgi:hypothetical protein
MIKRGISIDLMPPWLQRWRSGSREGVGASDGLTFVFGRNQQFTNIHIQNFRNAFQIL